jgi:putative PIN family toxin of toxin-antitoxin system
VKVFLDTNVLASALGTRGLCTEVFEAVIDNHILLTSAAVLGELERVLTVKFRLPRPTVHAYLELMAEQAQVMPAVDAPSRGIQDPVDGAIVASAAAAGADVFVTGDKALLEVGSIDGMPIKSPRDFWMMLTGLEGR